MADFIVTTLDDEAFDGSETAGTPDGAGLSLREALALANGNGATPDTITFAASLSGQTLFLTNGELEITTDGITVDGDINGDGTADITISADSALGADDADSPVFLISDGAVSTISATLNGLVIRDGEEQIGTIGSGISVGEGDRLNLSDATVTGNHGVTGGGIAAENNASLTLTNVTISNNSGLSTGGGIHGGNGSTITLTDSTVSGNTSPGVFILPGRGAGIFGSTDATITLNNSTISNNQAGYQGGGIFGGAQSTITLTNSTVSGNSTATYGVEAGGGILALRRSDVTLTNSTVSDNHSYRGGGLAAYASDVTLNNATVFGNSAAYIGGGLMVLVGNLVIAPEAASLTLNNSTVSGNSAGLSGGGIAAGGDGAVDTTVTLNNSILFGNDTRTHLGDEIGFDSGGIEVRTGGNIIGGYLIVGGVPQASGIALTDVFASVALVDPDGTGTLRDVSPFEAGVLADNGGPVQTIALNPNALNPAIDTGTGTLPADAQDIDGDNDTGEALPLDAHGETRVVGAAADLGALEVQAPILVVTTLDDENDAGATAGNPGGAGLSLREALALANADPDANTITFDASLTGGTLFLTTGQELQITGDVTIDGDFGGDGVADITIDADSALNADDAASRIFLISNGSTDISANLNGLVIRNGNMLNGGGILVETGDALTLTNSIVSDNTARSSSIISRGGGIHGTLGTEMVLNNVTVTGNSTSLDGGGIFSEGTLTLTNTTVSGNLADGGGGGISAFIVRLTNSTLSGNTTGWYGGGLLASNATLTNTTVTGNSAYADGGVFAGNATLTNSIIAGNSAEVRSDDFRSYTSLTKNGGNIIGNDVFDGNGSTPTGTTTLAEVFAELVTIDPQPLVNVAPFQAGRLADNGGPVQTVKLNPDATNPAIDTGDPTRLDESVAGVDLNGDGDTADTITTDARGFARDVDFGGTGPAGPDLGAFEQQAGASFVVTTLDDELDASDTDFATVNLNDLSLREALALAEQDPTSLDAISFHASLIGGNNPGVDDGVLTLVQGELAVFGNVSIDGDVNGDDTPDITVDGVGASTVFHIYSGAATLNGLTITGGNSSYGGGVAVGSSFFGTTADVTISNSTLSGNYAGYGGGVSVDPGSSLRLVNSNVSDNQAAYAGGGIANAGTLTVINSIVSGNEANLAGYAYSGGGLYNVGSATVIGSTISDNDGGNAGGGIFNTDELTLVNTTLSGNSAGSGGGIANLPGCGCGSSTATLINSTLSGNVADFGGGIFSQQGTLDVISSTLSGNLAAVEGGGIASINDVAATLTNSIVAGNSAAVGAVSDVYALPTPMTYSGVNVFSQVGAGDADDIVETDLANIFAGVVEIDPDGTPNNGDEFQAGALADNGGAVETILILAGGAAHNAGDNTGLPSDTEDLDGDNDFAEPLPVDARDVTRVLKGTVDIGAVELENSAPLVAIPILDQNSPANAFWTFQVPAGSLDDPDNDPLTFSATLGNGDPLPYWLTFNPLTQTFTGTPPRGFVGPIELTVTADDGTASTPDTFTLTVTASNPGPVNLTPNPDTYNAGNIGETINGLGSNDTITGGLGNDFINGNDGNDIIDGGGFSNVLHGDGGNDYVASTGNLNEGWGDAGTDQLFFVGNQNQLFGGDGNDWHGVSGTNNALAANGGDDWLGATGNFNTLNGQDGNDFLTTTGVGNVLHGVTGNDWLGVSGDLNQLFGGAGNDWLGATGNDNVLDGGAGNDTLVAAPGTHQGDVFNYRPGYAQDEIIGFSRHNAGGTDMVSIQGFGVTTFTQLQTFMTQSGGDTVITLNTADILIVRGVAPGTLQASDFLLA